MRIIFLFLVLYLVTNANAAWDPDKEFISDNFYHVKTQENVSTKLCLKAVRQGKSIGKLDDKNGVLGNVYYIYKDHIYDVNHSINYENLMFTLSCRRVQLP